MLDSERTTYILLCYIKKTYCACRSFVQTYFFLFLFFFSIHHRNNNTFYEFKLCGPIVRMEKNHNNVYSDVNETILIRLKKNNFGLIRIRVGEPPIHTRITHTHNIITTLV